MFGSDVDCLSFYLFVSLLSDQFTFNYHFFTHFLQKCSMLNRQLHNISPYLLLLRCTSVARSDFKWAKKMQTDWDYTIIVCKLVENRCYGQDSRCFTYWRRQIVWLNYVEKTAQRRWSRKQFTLEKASCFVRLFIAILVVEKILKQNRQSILSVK